MDIITQGLLGSTVAQAAYSKRLGKKAALFGLLIGLLPDFDIISGLGGAWASLKYHRGPTHSVLVLAALALPTGWLCKRLARCEGNLKDWVGLAFLSLVTHPIIDLFTSYGTNIIWPVSNKRFALDALPIIDPIYSLPLLIATIAGLSGLFTFKRCQSLAIGALVFSSLYTAFGYNNSQSLVKEGNKLFLANGFNAVEVRATPTFFNTWVFRVFGRDKDNNYIITYMRKGKKDPIGPIVQLSSSTDEFTDIALNETRGKLFKWFAMDMIQTESVKNADGTHHVFLNDMRYGMLLSPGKSLFSARASFDKQGNLIDIERQHRRSDINIKEELKATITQAYGSVTAGEKACAVELPGNGIIE